jgi:hypothetical protein
MLTTFKPDYLYYRICGDRDYHWNLKINLIFVVYKSSELANNDTRKIMLTTLKLIICIMAFIQIPMITITSKLT